MSAFPLCLEHFALKLSSESSTAIDISRISSYNEHPTDTLIIMREEIPLAFLAKGQNVKWMYR